MSTDQKKIQKEEVDFAEFDSYSLEAVPIQTMAHLVEEVYQKCRQRHSQSAAVLAAVAVVVLAGCCQRYCQCWRLYCRTGKPGFGILQILSVR